MKTNIIAVTGIGLLVLFVAGFASIFEIRLATAQVDATSSRPSISDATTTALVAGSISTVPVDASSTPPLVQTSDASSTIDTAAPSDAVTKLTSMISSVVPIEPAPIGFTL